MPKILIKRGTREQLDAAAAAYGLAVGELYLITNEGKLAVGIGSNSYSVSDANVDPALLIQAKLLAATVFGAL